MEGSENTEVSPKEHVEKIFKSFSVSSRVLESFTNLSNTVIDTALSGQNKFVFEILQNADDSCNDLSKNVTVKFALQNGYFIIQHNGKKFDFLDVERICDFASSIKEVKATDITKTGYKGLGFKSLFNISKCIYICSGGYSFRFDKTYWSNPEIKPWQVIPVWSETIPLSEIYKYDESNVNIILAVKKAKQLEKHLMEVIEHPECFLYLHHVSNFRIMLFGKEYLLERKVEDCGSFSKCIFYKNQSIASTWLSTTFQSDIPSVVQNKIRKGSKYTYPDKIKEATKVPITFTIEIDETGKQIKSMNNGICFNTLPTQLQLTLPYHINSFFILNLDRTQVDENDLNEFIFEKVGYLQLNMLKDLAAVPHLKKYLVELFTPQIKHSYSKFNQAFSRGLSCAKNNVAWLPAQEGSSLLKLDEAWIDEINFFRQNFKDIHDQISKNIIDYDVIKQYLLPRETKRFTYNQLFNNFSNKYYPQLNKDSYTQFIRYLYKNLKTYSASSVVSCKLKDFAFLRTKDGTLSSPKDALLEDSNNPMPHFFQLNPIDNIYLPQSNRDAIKDWLYVLGAKRLKIPINILRESLFKWIDSKCLGSKINAENHIDILNYIANNSELLTKDETKKLKEHLLVFTESKEFKLLKTCYLPEASPIKELDGVISREDRISPVYDMDALKRFLIELKIRNTLTPITLLRKTILEWIKKDEIMSKLTLSNYTAIVEFFASQYSKIEEHLTQSEKSDMMKMLVLTCAQTFKKADTCYFDSVLPDVPGFECAIPKENLVCSKNISRNVHIFLVKIGVSKQIEAREVIQKTVFKWIQENTIKAKINITNHQSILKYISEISGNLYVFEEHERNYFSMFPILTKGNTFKEARHCYWQTDGENIPNIESIVSGNDFISSEYKGNIKELLRNEYFSVRSLRFEDICEKYCNHLTNNENINWFFYHLINYWNQNCLRSANRLLTCVKRKLDNSHLLAKNGRLYLPAELYSSRFCNIHNIDPNCLPILDCKNIPEDLERFLGFKTNLEMSCMVNLLEAFGKEQKKRTLNEEKTKAFFTTLLEQLKNKNKNEIKKYTLKLLSNTNDLTPANELYYFNEENAKCTLHDKYLKRICGMSHKNTLELAILCDVNVLPFHIDANFKKEKYDNTLREFYLERLPLIVVKESKERNDPPSATLNNLIGSVSSIKLIECDEIYIKYPFGEPVKERRYFDGLKIYVVDEWRDHKSHIHKHIKNILSIRSDIDDIMDMQSVSQKKIDEFLQDEKEDPEIFYEIEKKIQSFLSGQENKEIIVNLPSDYKPEKNAANSFPQNLSESKQEQAPYNKMLTSPLKTKQISVDQQLFESKSRGLFEEPFFRSLNIYSEPEQANVNTFKQFGGQANKQTLNEQPLNSKVKPIITDPNPQKIYNDSMQQQRFDDITCKNNYTAESKNLNMSYDSTVDEDGEEPLLQKCNVDSRLEQTPYNNTFPSIHESSRNAFQQISEPKLDKYFTDIFLHTDDLYSQPKQTTYSNTHKQSPEQAVKITFNEPPSNSVVKNDKPDITLQKFDVDAIKEGIPDNFSKVFLASKSKRISDKHFTDFEASKTVPDSLLQKFKVDFMKEKLTDNILTHFSGHENKIPSDAQGYVFKENKGVTDLFLEKFEVLSEEESTSNALKRILCQESKKYLPVEKCVSKSAKIFACSPVQKCNIESEQEKSYGLKEFYLKRLPLIVVRESKYLNKSPYVILNSLYNKVASIELIQYKRMDRKNTCNVSITANCYFDELKIYFPGQWTDYKREIHRHIIQELCLESNVEDIIDMEITENSKEDWIHFNKENLQTLHLVENTLRMLLQSSPELNDRENDSSRQIYSDQLRDNAMPNKNVTAKKARKISTKCKKEKQHSVANSTKSGSCVTFLENEDVSNFERIDDIGKKDTSSEVKVYIRGSSLNMKISQPRGNYAMVDQDMNGSSQENINVKSSHVLLPVTKTENSKAQRLNEIYVFTFLRDYYKSKHPNARYTLLSNGYFKLEWESHEIVLTWANKIEETDGLFDISLEKDGEFKQFIEVQSVNAIGDILNINHGIFYKRSGPFDGLFQERQSFREKFRIYCVLRNADSASIEETNEPSALYKIKPLKLLEF